MIEFQPFVNLKNVKKTPAERQKVKDRDMNDIRQEDTERAIGGIAVTGLLGTELNIALVVVLGIDAILVSIMGR